jgi:uncharacterized repeat protein (TIGR03809 family)
MSARPQPSPYDSVSRKWLALAERRKAHFIDLYDSGRWKHYYTEARMVAEMRAAILACDDWAQIVSALPPVAEPTPEPATREASRASALLQSDLLNADLFEARFSLQRYRA